MAASNSIGSGQMAPVPSREAAHRLAIAGLPGMGPGRFIRLVRDGPAEAAWQRVTAGEVFDDADLVANMGKGPRELAARWRDAARTVDPVGLAAEHQRAGVTVMAHHEAGAPVALADDQQPPMVLCSRGDHAVFAPRRVAVVGTRRATRYGIDVARELGRDLAAAGVAVVSGLALGIDGAAHRGALDAEGGAAPVGVVAGGLDAVYPRRHRDLWEAVGARGVLCTEWPLGTAPEPWRFPARNRIIAGLAEALVVVESPGAGGSMYTVEQALARDVDVLAVPGPVRSAASVGTNKLLADGAEVCRGVDDVLCALGLRSPTSAGSGVARSGDADSGGAAPGTAGPGRNDAGGSPTRRDPTEVVVLDALGWEPRELSSLIERSGLAFADLTSALASLEVAGMVARRGLFYEQVSR